MRRLRGFLISVILTALAAGGLWYWAQPGPPVPGDARWCRMIFDKPTDTWTFEEAQGYAELNCMRWRFERTPPANQE